MIVPFWLILGFGGFPGMIGNLAAELVAGGAVGVAEFLVLNFHGPWLVDVAAAFVSLAALTLFLKVWKPKRIWRVGDSALAAETQSRRDVSQKENNILDESVHPISVSVPLRLSGNLRPWLPWIIL